MKKFKVGDWVKGNVSLGSVMFKEYWGIVKCVHEYYYCIKLQYMKDTNKAKLESLGVGCNGYYKVDISGWNTKKGYLKRISKIERILFI